MTSDQRSFKPSWIGMLTAIAVLAPIVLVVYSLRFAPLVLAALGSVTAFIATGRLLIRRRRGGSTNDVVWPSYVRLTAAMVAGWAWVILLRLMGEELYWGFAGTAVFTAGLFWLITIPWPMRKRAS